MFSYEHLWVMILGICMALGFILGSSYFVYKMFATGTKEIRLGLFLLYSQL
jgi:hypothetical protein